MTQARPCGGCSHPWAEGPLSSATGPQPPAWAGTPTIQGCWREPRHLHSGQGTDREDQVGPSGHDSPHGALCHSSGDKRLPQLGESPGGHLRAAGSSLAGTQAQGTCLVPGPRSQSPGPPERLSIPRFPPHPSHANISDQGPHRVSAEAQTRLRVPCTPPSSPARRTPYLLPRARNQGETVGRRPYPEDLYLGRQLLLPRPRSLRSPSPALGRGQGGTHTAPGPTEPHPPTPRGPHLAQPPDRGRRGEPHALLTPFTPTRGRPGKGPSWGGGVQAEPGS